jgi:hypothetical protein
LGVWLQRCDLGKLKIITSTKANAMFGNGVIWAILKNKNSNRSKGNVWLWG